MIGIIVLLIISWVLLKFIEKENLSVLGFSPTKQRLKEFGIGLLLPILYFSILLFTIAYLNKNPYKVNSNYTINDLFVTIWYLFKSVAFENLIFTGAILYILIKRIGATKATIISAIAFGIYHWFSWNLFGQPIQMAIVFLTTGVTGCLWAMAFYKTRSMYLPFALHFGINFVFMIIFSMDKNIGLQFLTKTLEKDPSNPGTFISILFTILYFIGFPLLTYFYLRTLKVE